MKKIKELYNNQIVKIIRKIVRTIILTILGIFIIVVCLQRFTNNKVSFFNYRMFTVITGSMKPKYNVGDVLISKETAPAKIKVGDTITYLGDERDFTNKVVTHQVIKVDYVNNQYYFHAKGLANLVEDPIVSQDQLYGVVVYKSGLLSFIYKAIITPIGFFIFIIIPLMFVIGSEMVTSLLEKEEARRERLKKKKQK